MLNVAKKNHGFPVGLKSVLLQWQLHFATMYAQAYIEPSPFSWMRQVRRDPDRTADVPLRQSLLSQVSCCLQKS